MTASASRPGVPATGPEPAVAAPATTPAQRASARVRQGVRDMVVSLGVVLVVVMLVAMPWRRAATVQPVADWAPVAAAFAASVRWPVLVPSAPAPGWTATSARIVPTVDGRTALHVGWLTADQQYLALEQSDTADVGYVRNTTDDGAAVPSGAASVELGGRSWQRLVSADDSTRSLVLREPTRTSSTGVLTYVVTGSAQWKELEAFAASLHPQPR